MKRVITYGTFDVLHYGHINLLKRARALGDYLIVALSSDVFVMGDDWEGKFDFLKDYCEVVYLPRTPDVCSTETKKYLNKNN